jgi:hypothetical protein
MRLGDLNQHERKLAEMELQKLESQRLLLTENLPLQIKAVVDASEKSFSDGLSSFTFDSFLEQIVKSDLTGTLPRSFYLTLLLDMFGYKSKLSNRRSRQCSG